MKTIEITRRTLIQAALSSAALLAIPLPRRRQAFAATGAPHFLITCIADGGWDPTQVLDVHDPLDMTDDSRSHISRPVRVREDDGSRACPAVRIFLRGAP